MTETDTFDTDTRVMRVLVSELEPELDMSHAHAEYDNKHFAVCREPNSRKVWAHASFKLTDDRYVKIELTEGANMTDGMTIITASLAVNRHHVTTDDDIMPAGVGYTSWDSNVTSMSSGRSAGQVLAAIRAAIADARDNFD